MRTTLTTKFVLIASAIAAIGLLNGVMAFVFTRSVADCFRTAVRENLPSVKAAEELEIALSDQKGLVSAYILSAGDGSWRQRLREAEMAFEHWLSRARKKAKSTEERKILDKLAECFLEYDSKRNKAIDQFNRGQQSEAIATLLHEVWPAYDQAYRFCEEFIGANERSVGAATERAEGYVGLALWGVSIGSLGTAAVAMMLLWLVIRGVLIPLRGIAADARGLVTQALGAATESPDDELRSIGVYFRALMADVADSRTTLARTRSRLLNAEKLAAVGKLAASVAHEMRNPLSSIKMWLYSIRKSAGADSTLDRKYQVLADEVARLESIVRNVLEFSRPAALKLQPQSIVQVMESTLELVGPWLEAKNIRVAQRHPPGLPQVIADSEQLKQVFSNLLYNAAEAMPGGGEIEVSSALEPGAGVVVRIRDSGEGIPADVRSRLFEPFFTTKDEGTGLGLCIAANIMARHRGQLVLESSTAAGTTFAVSVPLAEEKSDGQDSRR